MLAHWTQAAQCWFTKSYGEYNTHEKEETQKNPKKPEDSGSKDIRTFKKRKRDDEGDDHMEDVGMIEGDWDEEFAMAVVEGEFAPSVSSMQYGDDETEVEQRQYWLQFFKDKRWDTERDYDIFDWKMCPQTRLRK